MPISAVSYARERHRSRVERPTGPFWADGFSINYVKSVLGKHPPFPFSESDASLVCEKMDCAANDIDCILNSTLSIQWEYVALPSIPAYQVLEHPVPILRLSTAGTSVYPILTFTIESGNEEGYFDVVRDKERANQGTVRLLRGIPGPRNFHLRMRMDNRNAYNYIMTSHVANVFINVGRWNF